MSKISIYIMAPLVSWLLAQLLKYLFNVYKRRSFSDVSVLYESGGMPSAHSALVTALSIVIGARVGVDSALFGMTVIFSMIVIYDAINVRRAVGEQGLVLKKLQNDLHDMQNFYRAKGHTVPQAIAGSAIGLAIALICVRFF
jgi:acid phosphatase family membrane protein YuiD